MKSRLAMWMFLAVALSAASAADTRYMLYNLPPNTGMALVGTGEEFLDALRTKYGTTAPAMKSESYGIQTGMPAQFRNSIHGACAQVRNIKLMGYVEVYLYANPPQQAQGKEFCAFALDFRSIQWLWALVKADKRCDDAKFDDNARRLVMAFASKIGNYNRKGYVKDKELDIALDLFVAELKTRGVERMENEAPVLAFESAVEKMPVEAGNVLYGNDGGAALSKRALDLLPASLAN